MNEQKLTQLVNQHEVVLFMKGTAQAPQCGFSATAVAILKALALDFTTIDVLADPEVRSGMKVYSDWPTFPQLYIRSEFMGGVDIMRQLYESGELAQMFSTQE